ncbi:phage tail assembly protein [Rhodopseudomonas palustris]|nr:phage tail assembly protein [Rhodopseudomonas palustris]
MSTDPVTVTLSKPIAIPQGDDKPPLQITAMTFREATAGDACLADLVQGETSKILAILSGMSGQPLPVLQKLPMRDFNKVLAATAPLMGEPHAAAGGSTL